MPHSPAWQPAGAMATTHTSYAAAHSATVKQQQLNAARLEALEDRMQDIGQLITQLSKVCSSHHPLDDVHTRVQLLESRLARGHSVDRTVVDRLLDLDRRMEQGLKVGWGRYPAHTPSLSQLLTPPPARRLTPRRSISTYTNTMHWYGASVHIRCKLSWYASIPYIYRNPTPPLSSRC
jgi:hypothetical protein